MLTRPACVVGAVMLCGLTSTVGASGLEVPDGCIGMGGFCASNSDCQGHGRDGVCGADARCYQTCRATATRAAAEVSRSLTYCCNYGAESPIMPAAVQDVPKHWGEPRFRGKRVLITGGDSGIGFAAVQAFYLECAQVMLTGRSLNKSEAAYEEIKKLPVPQDCAGAPPSIAWMMADVTNSTQAAGLVSRIVQEFGGLDIAVNNAGTAGSRDVQIGAPGFLDESGDLYDESIFDVNIKGTLKCMNAEIAHWSTTGTTGVIVNVASIEGEVSWGGPLYLSSKWAMIGFTKQAALANAGKGVRINAVAPGAVNTPMLRGGLSPTDPRWIARKKLFEGLIPAHHIGEPWEMAGPITFLASDMSSYVVGAVLTADGDVSQASPFGLKHDIASTPPAEFLV